MGDERRLEGSPSGPGPLARWILGPHRQIVLASRSPRRLEILASLGVPVRVVAADVDETFSATESPEEGAVRVALLKALAAAAGLARGADAGARGSAAEARALVLAADTVVVAGGVVLGKPSGAADARRMLALLSGRAHRVVTGVALGRAGAGLEAVSGAAVTEVLFRDLEEREIDEYVATGEPLDKAGAYGIQGLGALLVREVRGDYSNVVGLPIQLLLELARRAHGTEGDRAR
jgi:septum formation protein